MEVYLLRHGEAEEPLPGVRDADRGLTEEGRRALRAVLERARQLGVSPSLLLSSPLRRARQSAEIAVEVLGYSGEIVETPALAPSSSPEILWSEIRALGNDQRLLLVGHQPLLGAAYAHFLRSPSLRIAVEPGSLGCLELAGGGAQPFGAVRWLLSP
jgi:phosphohistidine phosphatase